MANAPAQTWWSPAELAEAGLPDLPSSKRNVNALAAREGWQNVPECARPRRGQGGGWEYHWTLLPVRARTRLMDAARSECGKDAHERRGREETWTVFDALPAGPRAKAQTRLNVLQRVEALEATGATREAAISDVAQSAKVSARSIWNWFGLVAGIDTHDRLAYLAPRHRMAVRKSGPAPVDPEFAALLKSDFLRLSQPSFRSCYDRTVRAARERGIEIVPEHTARRWLNRTVSKPTQVLLRKGMDALKRLYPAQTRSKAFMHAMEAINGDYHRFDVFVRWPDGSIVRPQMVAFQDLYSGKMLSWRISTTANSHTVQQCLGDLIEEWGIPQHVLLDNGREFAAKTITGGTPTRFRFKVTDEDIPGLLTTLGCKVHWATPYAGQSKPIERAFRDLCDRVAKHPAFEGAYTGNSPDAKPENYGNRAVPLEEFLAVLEVELAEHNAREGRRSEVAFGRSFNAVFNESYATAPIRKATEEQRRLWLLGAEGVQGKKDNGELALFKNRYWSEWMYRIAGQKVVARFDEQDLHSGLHVYALSGEYLGHAAAIETAGFFSTEDARTHAKARGAWMKAQRDVAKAHKELSAAEIAAGLATAPVPEDTPPAAQVVQIVTPPRKPAPKPAQDPDHEAQLLSIIDRLDQAERIQEPGSDPAAENFERALELEAQLEGGIALTEAQQVWLAQIQQSSSYRAHRRLAGLALTPNNRSRQ